MPKRATATALPLDITFSSEVPLHRQLYSVLKRAILDGRLRAGSRLPSTRTIAEAVHVSRTTVLNAFEQLSAEGYLQGKVGSGTRVALCIPGDLGKRARRVRSRSAHSTARLSKRGRIPRGADLSFLRTSARPLRPGEPE